MIKKANNKIQIKLTPKQSQAWRIIESHKHTLLFGGSRSGKTFLIILYIILSCLQHSGLWALIARLKFTHVKTSIWQQTLIPLLTKLGIKYEPNKTDLTVEFPNGSKIWLGGLDSIERVEKVLGQEYSIIFLNEISQLSYEIVNTARTRLAQNLPTFSTKMFYDCNPPSPQHWSHKEFIEFSNPITGEPIDPKQYGSLLMNPIDNVENLSQEYLQLLDQLPPRLRARFRDGQWVKPEGMIYESFSEEYIISEFPAGWQKNVFAGFDFGLNMAAVFVTEIGGVFYILGDYGAYGMTSTQFNREAQKKFSWHTAYCDPAGGERIFEIYRGQKAINDVEDGIDFILELINNGRLRIHTSATGVLHTIYDYRRDENGRIIKENDHYMDAMRYAIYTYHRTIGEKHSVKEIILGKNPIFGVNI